MVFADSKPAMVGTNVLPIVPMQTISIPAVIMGTIILLQATRPLTSKEKKMKQTKARKVVPQMGGMLRTVSAKAPQADIITKKPQNIKADIKSLIYGASFPETNSISSSNVDRLFFRDIVIVMQLIAPKLMDAMTGPVQSVCEGMLKYSKISRPEANPAPITRPIKTDEMLRICFIRTMTFLRIVWINVLFLLYIVIDF